MRAYLKTLIPGMLVVAFGGSQKANVVLAAPAQDSLPVTDDEVRSFARQLEQAAAKRDSAAFIAMIDWDAILDMAVADFDAPAEVRDGFKRGAKSRINSNMTVAAEIVESMKKGGAFRFLRARVKDKRKTGLFRIVEAENSGLNYLEFALARQDGRGVRAVDLYIGTSGEWLSKTMRGFYLRAVATGMEGRPAPVLDADREFLQSLPKMDEMDKLQRAGRYREALIVYDKLPASLQKSKSIVLLRLNIARQLDDTVYTEAMQRFLAQFPGDSAADLISIDFYVLRKEYDMALATLDRLDRAVGGDPYLNVQRAMLHLAAGRLEKAREAALAAVDALPDLLSVYYALLTVDLAQKDYVDLLRTLKLMDQRFVMKWNDLVTVPEYAGFAKSPQYAEWQRYLEEKQASQLKSPPPR